LLSPTRCYGTSTTTLKNRMVWRAVPGDPFRVGRAVPGEPFMVGRALRASRYGSAGRLAPPDAESAIHGMSVVEMIPHSPAQRKRDFVKAQFRRYAFCRNVSGIGQNTR